MEILLVLQVIVVIAMIAVILLQKSGADGFTGSSSPNSFMTGRASANLFTRITSILATIFIINSLVLAYIASHTERAGSILEQAADEAAKESKGSKGSLLNLEQKMKDMNNPNSKPADTNKSDKVEEKTEENPVATEEQKSATPSVPVSE
jgi:preprotein translocase subunit SecG